MPQLARDAIDPVRATPGLAVQQFPTPNTHDLIVVEDVELRNFAPLPPKTPHPSNATTGLGLFLVWQGPASGTRYLTHARRVYANDRTEQDAYNYAIQYVSDDPASPIVMRSYVTERDTYVPLAKWTPDPLMSHALLIKEDMQRITDDERLANVFVRVTRVYHTLPGPPLVTKTLGAPDLTPAKYRSLLVEVETNQPVRADYAFPPGLFGDESQIILQQETVALARLKIIEQIISLSGALTGHELGEYGQVTITETVVIDGTPEDEGFYVISSRVEPFGNGKSIKITASVSSYPTRYGQNYERKLGAVIPYTDDIVASGTIGTPNSEITPMDSRRSRKRTFDPTSVLAALSAIQFAFPDTADVYIPDELTALDAIYSDSLEAGAGSDSSSGLGSGTSYFFKVESHSSGQSGYSVSPELIPTIAHRPGRNRPTTRYSFFVSIQATPALTRSLIVSTLAGFVGSAVDNLPNWRPAPLNFALKGQSVHLRQSTNHSVSESSNSDGSSVAAGNGSSEEYSVSSPIGSKYISPTIHAALAVSNPTHTSGSASGSVTPDSISATTPSSIPSSGYVLLAVHCDLYEAPILMVDAEVLDWADV